MVLRVGGPIGARCLPRVPSVLEAQKSTIEVLHTLRPLIVVMAGVDMFDPYKD